jgi:hypothetical protein
MHIFGKVSKVRVNAIITNQFWHFKHILNLGNFLSDHTILLLLTFVNSIINRALHPGFEFLCLF